MKNEFLIYCHDRNKTTVNFSSIILVKILTHLWIRILSRTQMTWLVSSPSTARCPKATTYLKASWATQVASNRPWISAATNFQTSKLSSITTRTSLRLRSRIHRHCSRTSPDLCRELPHLSMTIWATRAGKGCAIRVVDNCQTEAMGRWCHRRRQPSHLHRREE